MDDSPKDPKIAGLPDTRSSGMKAISRFLFVSALAVVLTACSSSGRSPDNTLPVITLTGDNPQFLEFGEAYVELGATASDNRDGGISASIVIDATSVDTSTPGDYTVTYNVTDAASNVATVTRTVTVRPPIPEQATVAVEGDIKQLILSWDEIQYTDLYRLMENPDGHSGFTQVGDDIPADTLTASRDVAVHLFDWVEAQYLVEACNVKGCSTSDVITAIDVMLDTIGYFKASNTDRDDRFGRAVELSADGRTLAVGAGWEDSCATGINGDQDDNSCEDSGAVYLFRLGDNGWYEQAYIKASNTDANDYFGAVELSADGNTLAVGASEEDSCATGLNGNQDDNACVASGAVYVFRFEDNSWYQQAYIKAANADAGDRFGGVAISADGKTLAVGAMYEGSNPNGGEGATYIFRFDDDAWHQQAYIKASNAEPGDQFGRVVELDAAGGTLAVGAPCEESTATGINGDQTNNSGRCEGAAYLFRFEDNNWYQQAYIKASDTKWHDFGDYFGLGGIALSEDGDTLAVGAHGEEPELGADGAVYLFRFANNAWYQQGYFRGPESFQGVAGRVALSGDGNTLLIGAPFERTDAVGVYVDSLPSSDAYAHGAVYQMRFDGFDWRQVAFIKASYTDSGDVFGSSIALSADGQTLAVSAVFEDSLATGIGGDQSDNSSESSGAVYIY
jgi:hypothetical protein